VSESVTPKNLRKPPKSPPPANSPVNKRKDPKNRVDKPRIVGKEGRISPDKRKSGA
jgi:hypothetical protein